MPARQGKGISVAGGAGWRRSRRARECDVEKESRFKYESAQDTDSLHRYLEALTAGFASGDIRFSSRDGEVALHPRGMIGFLIEAKSSGGRMKLHLKFSWREGATDDETADSLTIAAGESGD
jgi:amphi-Trp domain-containing protein